MKRFQSLNRYQKSILALMAAMVLMFAAVYGAATARKGFLYQNAILVPAQADGVSTYAGRIRGETAVFTVSADKTVTFQYGGRIYGPYTAREAPAAVPQGHQAGGQMAGVELYCGGELLFRGGVLELDGRRWLYNADGSPADDVMTVTVTYGNQDVLVMDENGKVIDPMEPSVSAILDLMAGPALTHKGVWPLWACGALLCVFTAVSILFADELFRFEMAFRIRHADTAQPSGWEMAGRYVAWAVLPAAALAVFIAGLQ